MAKNLPLATFAYNTFNTPNLGNYSPYKLVFGRKPKTILNLDSTPDIKVSGTFKGFYEFLNNRLQYLHKLLLDFKSKRLDKIHKDRTCFQYNSRFSLHNFTTHKSIVHCFKKSYDKICRTSSFLQNYRPTQLFINDIRWQNTKRTF